MESYVSVGEDVMDDGTVLTLSAVFADFLMLMLFQMLLSVRRAWRSFNRSSLCRAGGERRTWKARLAGGRQDRHGMLPDGKCYRLRSDWCRRIGARIWVLVVRQQKIEGLDLDQRLVVPSWVAADYDV